MSAAPRDAGAPAALPEGCHQVAPGHLAAVVTHLEMTAPPVRSPLPMPEGAVLRRIERPRPDWYRDLFRRVGGPWLWLSRLRMPAQQLEAILADPRVEVRAVRMGGRAEGLLELDFREEGACEIAFFGLTEAAQGRGIGRAMMDVAVDRAFARGVGRLTVHTCTLDSPAALPFYLSSGFRAVRREVEVFADPRADALLPPDAAPGVPVLR